MGQKMVKNSLFGIMSLAIVFMSFGSYAAETYTMKLAIVTQNDPIHIYIKEFKKRIEAKTNGRIKAEVYPAGQLGRTPRLIEGVQLGTIEMVLLPPGFFKGVNPAFQVTEAPGVFDGIQHANDSLTDPEFRDKFLKIAENKGMTGVSLWIYGPTSYASLTPLHSLADFKGKKFRVLATKVESELMKSVGATGVPMSFGEITPGLQRKAIDGVRSSIVVLAGIKVFSVAKNITIANDSVIAVVAMGSKKFLDKLPADLRQDVMEVGQEMEAHMLNVSLTFNEKARKIWADAGAEVIDLSADDRKTLMTKGKSIADRILGSDPQTKDLYNTMKKMAQKHAN